MVNLVHSGSCSTVRISCSWQSALSSTSSDHDWMNTEETHLPYSTVMYEWYKLWNSSVTANWKTRAANSLEETTDIIYMGNHGNISTDFHRFCSFANHSAMNMDNVVITWNNMADAPSQHVAPENSVGWSELQLDAVGLGESCNSGKERTWDDNRDTLPSINCKSLANSCINNV